MSRARTAWIALAVAAAVAVASAVVRHLRAAGGRTVAGGILVRDAGAYDVTTRLLFGSFRRGVAADVAAIAPEGARVLEIGCGPGHLALELAGRGLDVTGLDLDPAMIGRARANARSKERSRTPTLMVGDVTSLPFPEASFDVVVSTLSMHHWDDPESGLAEIARVLRPDGRALVWDLRPGAVPFHRDVADPIHAAAGGALRVIGSGSWRWPGGLSVMRRLELAPA